MLSSLFVMHQVLAFDFLYQSIVNSTIYSLTILLYFYPTAHIEQEQIPHILVTALLLIVSLTISLQLHLKLATTMFLKNDELK